MSGQVLKYGIVQLIPLEKIDDSPFQIRMEYGDIEGLADDINKNDLLYPILIRPINDRYEIIHGHRRLRAIKLLNQKLIPAIIRKYTDRESLIIHGSENIKRENYSAIEEARYYKKCIENDISIREIATKGSRNPSHIQRYLDFLDLPNDIQYEIHKGDLSLSKARELTKLTKSTLPIGNVEGVKGFQTTERTDEYFEEIRILAKNPELRDHKAVSVAVDELKEGKTFQEAIELAKSDYQDRKHKERTSIPAPKPEELAKTIIANLPDPHKLDNKILDQYPRIVRELLNKKLLKCPYCGESHLVWKCNGREI